MIRLNPNDDTSRPLDEQYNSSHPEGYVPQREPGLQNKGNWVIYSMR